MRVFTQGAFDNTSVSWALPLSNAPREASQQLWALEGHQAPLGTNGGTTLQASTEKSLPSLYIMLATLTVWFPSSAHWRSEQVCGGSPESKKNWHQAAENKSKRQKVGALRPLCAKANIIALPPFAMFAHGRHHPWWWGNQFSEFRPTC